MLEAPWEVPQGRVWVKEGEAFEGALRRKARFLLGFALSFSLKDDDVASSPSSTRRALVRSNARVPVWIPTCELIPPKKKKRHR